MSLQKIKNELLKFRKHRKMSILVVCLIVCAFVLFIGDVRRGVITNSNYFLADIGQAFSNTFLKKETLLAEIDVNERDKTLKNDILSIECAFDSLDVPDKGKVIINEVAWMGSKDNYRDEWIELKNISSKDIDVSFWTLIDRGGDVSVKFPEGTVLNSGKFMVIGKIGAILPVALEFKGSLKNTGEHIRLFNSSCELEDEAGGAKWEAGDNTTKQTMERNFNGAGWHSSALPNGTIGKENSVPLIIATQNKTVVKTTNGTTNMAVVAERTESETSVQNNTSKNIEIVAVCTGTESNSGFEFIKLKNNSENRVDLNGWTLKKKSSTGNESTLVSSARFSGAVIEGGAEIFIAREEGYSGTRIPEVWWPKSYTLSVKKNGVALYGNNKQKIAETWWDEADYSMCNE